MRNYLLIFAGCVLFHVLGTWNLPLIDRDEPRFAEASREMRERQNWIVPYFNGQYRFDKPPLTYWAQVASYSLFGENDFAARFPSAIAAALTSVVILAWASHMSGQKTSWWAAIIFALSLQTFVHAKAAVADMWLVLFMTIAFWAGWQLLWRKSPTLNSESIREQAVQRATSDSEQVPALHAGLMQGVWWWIFYFALAFAFLAKGPIGLLPLLPLIWVNLRSPRSGFYISLTLGVLLTFGIICLWAVPALVQTRGEFFRIGIGRHVVARSIAIMEGHGLSGLLGYLVLLPFYFVTVFVSFFPWSVKLPSLAAKLWRNRDEIDNYLLAGTATLFVVFTLVVTKLPHYTLPAFPLLSLLLARHWNEVAWRERDGKIFCLTAATTAIVWIAIAFTVPLLVRSQFPAYVLARQSSNELRPEMKFAAVDYTEPSLVWYLRARVKEFLTPVRRNNAAAFMAEPGPRLIVLPTDLATELFADRPGNWKRFSTSGFNIAKGKRVDLTLLLKPE